VLERTPLFVSHESDLARVLVRPAPDDSELTSEVVRLLDDHGATVELVARIGSRDEETRIGYTIPLENLTLFRTALNELVTGSGRTLEIDDRVGRVSVHGIGMLNRPQHTARLLDALRKSGIETRWLSMSQQRTSAVISREKMTEAVSAVLREFEPEPVFHDVEKDQKFVMNPRSAATTRPPAH
jgi:aspartate kinase